MTNFDDIAAMATTMLSVYGLKIIGALVIIVVGWIVAGWVRRAVYNALGKTSKFDRTLRGFFASLARYLVLTVVLLAALSQVGIQTASLIAVLGAAGLAVGLALQGTLSNVAAGVMLLVFRPFRVGDFVEVAGIAGTVKSLNLFVTEFATPDNVHVVAPNKEVWNTPVRNYSFNPTRRIDLVVGIGYGDDIGKAATTILKLAQDDKRVLADPDPMTAVTELADSSVNIMLRVWCNRSDYWNVKFDLTRAMKEALDSAGVNIPYPQRDIHMIEAGS